MLQNEDEADAPALTGNPNVFKVYQEHFDVVIAAAKADIHGADHEAQLEAVRVDFHHRISAAKDYFEKQGWDGSADILKSRQDPNNMKYLLALRKLGKEIYLPAMQAMKAIVGVEDDKYYVKMLYRHIGKEFQHGQRAPAPIVGTYKYNGSSIPYKFEPISTEAHSSHSRNAYDASKPETYTGAANALLVTSGDDFDGKSAPTAQFYRQAAKMAYEMYKKPKLRDKIVAAGVESEIDFVRGIAADAFAGKLGALPPHVNSEENPLIIRENYLQLVSPIQGAIRGLVGVLDAGKYSADQMIDTQFVMKLLDGQKLQVDVPGQDQKKWIQFDLSMMTLGINEFGIYTTARQNTLNASGLMRLHDQVVEATRNYQGPEQIAIQNFGHVFEGDRSVTICQNKIDSINGKIDALRQTCVKPDGTVNAQAIKDNYQILQKMFSELDDAYLAKQKAYEAFRKTSEYKLKITAFNTLMKENPALAKTPLCNAIKMQLDFEQLYLSGDWREAEHYKEIHGLYLNVSHQLNQANAQAITAANHGCSSAMDRAEMATRKGASLAQQVAGNGGVYQQMYKWDEGAQTYTYEPRENMQVLAERAGISGAIAQSGVSQANHVANSSTTGGKSENDLSGLDEMNSAAAALAKFKPSDSFKERGKRVWNGFKALVGLTFTNYLTRAATYALGGVIATLLTVITLRPNLDLFRLVHAGIMTGYDKSKSMLAHASSDGLPKAGEDSEAQVKGAVAEAIKVNPAAEQVAHKSQSLASVQLGLRHFPRVEATVMDEPSPDTTPRPHSPHSHGKSSSEPQGRRSPGMWEDAKAPASAAQLEPQNTRSMSYHQPPPPGAKS